MLRSWASFSLVFQLQISKTTIKFNIVLSIFSKMCDYKKRLFKSDLHVVAINVFNWGCYTWWIKVSSGFPLIYCHRNYQNAASDERKEKKNILPVSTFRCIYVRIKSFINSTLNRCFSWWSHRTSHAVGLKSQPCWLEALIAFLGIQAAFKKRSSDKKILTFPSGFLFLMFIKRMPSHLLIFLLLPLPRRYFAITRCVSWNKSM